MRKKKVLLSLIIATTLIGFVSCNAKSKHSNSSKSMTESVVESSEKSNDESSSNSNDESSSEIESESEESFIPVSQSSIDIIPIEEESLLNTIYGDFNKAKLPQKYNRTSQDLFGSLISINEETQNNLLEEADCIEQKGYDLIDDNKVDFFIDAYKNMSEDNSYCGDILNSIIYDLDGYVNNLLQYEQSLYGSIETEYYYMTSSKGVTGIIKIEASNGSNTDIIVIDDKGFQSYINISNIDKIYETSLVKKGTISEDDLSILSSQPRIKYNNDGCQFQINDYEIKELIIPDYYRTVPFSEIDLDTLDLCYNLESIRAPRSSSKYKEIDGILYDSEVKELLYYPKAKLSDEYIMPDTVSKIRKGSLANIVNLKNITISDKVTKINDYEFENSKIESIDLSNVKTLGKEIFKNCENLIDLTLPYIEDSIVTLFSNKKNENLNEVEYNGKNYYVPSIESLVFLSGNVTNDTLLGIDTSLKNLVLPESVTELNENNFNYSLTNIEIFSANGVTSFGDKFFKGCTNLKEAYINGATSIGEDIFVSSANIEVVEMNSVKLIPLRTFINYENLKSIKAESVETIGQAAFSNCKGLKEVYFPNVTTIYDDAFSSCTGLKTADISKVTKIPNYAFSLCAQLTTVNCPKVTEVGAYAFNNCYKLAELNISKLTKVADYSFTSCYSITPEYVDITGITEIPKYCFYACKKLINNDNVKQVTKIYNYGLGYIDVTTFTEIDLSKVTYLGNGAFYYCTNLKKVTLPSSLKTIPDSAFSHCNLLKTINLGNVTEIGNYAFANCPLSSTLSLNGVVIGNNAFQSSGITDFTCVNTTIGEQAFFDSSIVYARIQGGTVKKGAFSNSGLTQVYTLQDVTLEESCFDSCNSLTKATIKSSPSVRLFTNCSFKNEATIDIAHTTFSYGSSDPKKLDLSLFDRVILNSITGSLEYSGSGKNKYIEAKNATSLTYSSQFKDRTNLESVCIPKVKKLSQSTFEGCTNLKSVDISSVDEMQNYVFKNCTSLESLTTYSTYINQNAFEGCTKFKTLNAPNLTGIYSAAFKNCTALTSVNFPNVTYVDSYVFLGCENLKKAEFASCTKVGDSTFSGCTSLTTVTMSNVTTIGSYAFENCTSLSSNYLTLGEKVASIDYGTFKGCTTLDRINLAKITSVPGSAFDGCTNLSGVYMPNVTTVGNSAFKNCSKLATYTIGTIANTSGVDCTYVTSVGDYAFYECTKLTTLDLTNATKIGQYAFYNCENLGNYYINYYKIDLDSVQTIGQYAFYGCSLLRYVKNSKNTLTTIGQYAFAYCTSLISFNLCEDTYARTKCSIFDYAFKDCYNLEIFTYNTGVTINSNAFSGCDKLTYLSLYVYTYQSNFTSMLSAFNNSYFSFSNIKTLGIIYSYGMSLEQAYSAVSQTSVMSPLHVDQSNGTAWLKYIR